MGKGALAAAASGVVSTVVASIVAAVAIALVITTPSATGSGVFLSADRAQMSEKAIVRSALHAAIPVLAARRRAGARRVGELGLLVLLWDSLR